jgi:hypothetical protein
MLSFLLKISYLVFFYFVRNYIFCDQIYTSTNCLVSDAFVIAIGIKKGKLIGFKFLIIIRLHKLVFENICSIF